MVRATCWIRNLGRIQPREFTAQQALTRRCLRFRDRAHLCGRYRLFCAAQLSLALLPEPDGVALFWPVAGVSSGLLIAPPIASGAIVATIVANLMGERNVWSAKQCRGSDRYPLDRRMVAENGLSIVCVSTPNPEMSETTVAQNAAEMQGCRRGRRAIALVEAQPDLSNPRQADATDVENEGAFGESLRRA